MRTFTTAERRARLQRRHHLSDPATEIAAAAAAMVGLHSSDPTTPYLAARARLSDFTIEDLEGALYEDRSVIRMLGMRRTLFVVPRHLASVMDVACARPLADRERRRLIGLVENQGLASDGGAWIDRVSEATLEALRMRGTATATELTRDVAELGMKVTIGAGTKWGGEFGMSTRILFLLATEGRIVRGRPRGSWLSSQYHWAPLESWLGEPLEEIDSDRARRDLATMWLRSFGPGTATDLKWWTGWNLGTTRAVLASLDAAEVMFDDGPGYVLPDDLEAGPPVEPSATLLPGLDPTTMGWKERDWYLGPEADRLFDRNGNAGPTIWWDGQVVGGWAQRDDATVAYHLLDDIGAEAEQAISGAAHDLERWLSGTRVRPRFRTPLERELTA